MSEKDYDPDNPQLSASNPDQPGFFNEQTLSAVSENELLKRELQKEKALRMQVQQDHHDERTDVEISQEFLDGEVEKIQDYYLSQEGIEELRRDVVNYWTAEATPEDPEKEARTAYFGPYAKRRAREEDKFKE